MTKPAGHIRVLLHSLDRLMPMHVIVGPTGHIRQVGPTLAKLWPSRVFSGARFLELFELKRPRNITSFADLRAADWSTLSVNLRRHGSPQLKGLAVALPDDDGLLVNLSLGISAIDVVGQYRLSGADFSATDLTVEMLYLVEAKQAVMDLSRNLNKRLQGAMIAAEEQAFTDTLTGLKNRRAMDQIFARYTAHGQDFGLMQIDLDYFKAVNDSQGHAAGDHVLQQVARILVEETRAEDTAVRAGGDEFVLIFHNLTARDRLGGIAERVLKRLELPIIFQDMPCRVSASIGIATSDAYKDVSGEQMLADADKALYASKKSGRARATFAPEGAGADGRDSPIRTAPTG